MKNSNLTVSAEELERQKALCALAAELLNERFGKEPKAFVHTYGCQGNVADSERVKGLLAEMGFSFCDRPEDADFVLFNTCAVREHAEARVFGNVGALKPIKEKKKNQMIIALCGCMMQQPHIAEKIRNSYDFVNLVFGTHALYRLPELMVRLLQKGKRVFEIENEDGRIAEGLPVLRDRKFKAWEPIMYGCNNFCSYCIVPYVRGRERSRNPDLIIKETEQLIASGVKEITLLGQNVNSYGKNTEFDIDFARLLRKLNALDGDFVLRFMTSHPKDCSEDLLEAMAECDKVERHLHLPFQSGNNEILARMNRSYTAEQYLALCQRARDLMSDLTMTSDVIVGFPGETEAQFEDTLKLVEQVRFSSLFTFIYSPRKGTRAAEMDDPVSHEEKTKWFSRLTKLQEKITAEQNAQLVGKSFRVLIEEGENGSLTGRSLQNFTIQFPGDEKRVGSFAGVRVKEASRWSLTGEEV